MTNNQLSEIIVDCLDGYLGMVAELADDGLYVTFIARDGSPTREYEINVREL